MKLIIVVMMMVAVTIASLPIHIQDIYADHYAQRRWQGTRVDLCYDSYGLSYLRIDNRTNQYTIVKQQLDITRNDWNNQPSRFTLRLIGGQYCSNWVYAANIRDSIPDTVAVAILCISNTCDYDLSRLPYGYINKAMIYFNTGTEWFTTRECSPFTTGKWTLNYVARHEFGHWVSFNHTFGSPSESVMYASYHCSSRNSVKPYDSTELSSIYG